MNYIIAIFSIIGVIVLAVAIVMIYAKITLQDGEILFWAKSEAKVLQLVDVNLKGISAMQKAMLFQQGIIKQLVDCNLEGGVLTYDKDIQELERAALNGLEEHNRVLMAFAKKHSSDKSNDELKVNLSAQQDIAEQIKDILGASPNKDALG